MNLKDKLSKQREFVEIDKKCEDMQAKMDAIEKQVTTDGAYVNLEILGSFLFTSDVDESMPPKGFKLPTKESYDGTADPINHLEMFRTSMSIQGVDKAIMCNAFPHSKEGCRVLVLIMTTKFNWHHQGVGRKVREPFHK